MAGNFSFGGASTGAPGQSNTSSAPSPGGLFGTAAKPTGTSSFSFGSSTTVGATGGNNQAGGDGSLFGNMNSSTPAAPGSLFGQTSSGPASGLFGGAAVKPVSSSLFDSSTSTTPAGGGLFAKAGGTQAGTAPPATSSISTSAPTAGGLFGSSSLGQSAAGGVGGMFGSAGANQTQPASSLFPSTNTSTLASQSTPAKPLFASSTTPAGAPPADAAKSTGSSGFGGLKIGGTVGDGKPFAASAFGSGPGSLFSSSASNTPASEPLAANASSQQAQGTPLATTSTLASLFGAKATQGSAPGSSTSLLGSKPSETTASGAAPSTTTTTGGLFDQKVQAGGLFGFKPAVTPSTSPGASATPAVSSLFGSAAAATPATSTATPALGAKPAGSSSLFGGAAIAVGANPATSTPKTTSLFGQATGTPSSTDAAATTAPSNGGLKPSSSTTATPGAAPSTILKLSAGSAASPSAGSSANAGLAASTMGPPSQLPRLKNKTMDEIITRWATDLTKYQKEFQEQASKVSEWDRLLVDNGEKIQKLFTSTYEAERASHEIERQLATVESQQDELAEWLDRYEKEVDELIAKQQLGAPSSMGGPDQERDRTYKLAEKLTDRLDKMGQDLSKMIKEINDMSGTLSKGNKPDDPLSQIVRVLNGHLAQLQWIDTNAAALQAKVSAAQKASSKMANGNGLENLAAESFYRSYIGRK